MATFNHIAGAEPSTITFKAATITQTRNSSVMHQEIISLGDPDSSLAIAAVLNAVPASTAWGLVTREAGGVLSSVGGVVAIQGNSTVFQGTNPWLVSVTNQVRVANSTVGELLVRAILSSTSTDNPVTVSGAVTVTGYSTIVSVANQVRVTNSTSGEFLVRPVFSSTNTDNPVRAILSSTGADNPVSVTQPIVWTKSTLAAVNGQASVTESSVAGIRPVCKGFVVTICATSTAPAAWQGSVSLIDGATGGSTYLWRSAISLPAVAGAMASIVRSGIWIPGSLAAPMTLEFSAAGGGNTIQSVSMEGTNLTV